MDASSRAAMAEARARLALVGQGAGGDSLLALADELFAVAGVLDAQPNLRRALADPSVLPEDRAGLARRLLEQKIAGGTLDIVENVARQRWSRPFDLVEAVETLAREAALDAAEQRRELDTVEDELFRFGRIIGGDPELSRLLGDRSASRPGKTALLDRLLAGRVSPVTERLVRNTLTSPHVHNAQNSVEKLSELASTRRGQSVAHVVSAVALTPEQQQRLSGLLERLYGRPVGLQVAVDPSVLGGLVVRVGDEVIDGSVAHRLEDAGRRLAG